MTTNNNNMLIGALLTQIEAGQKSALPALRAFKAIAEALPGIRQPDVIAALNRMCKHDNETLREEARAARLLMWKPEHEERVRVDGYPGRVLVVLPADKVTAEYDTGDALFVDDFYVWDVEPRTKTR